MKFLINGEFIDKSDHYDVINPYNGEIVDTVPIGYRSDADNAIEAANNAKKALKKFQTIFWMLARSLKRKAKA